jgi:hypothetical protein
MKPQALLSLTPTSRRKPPFAQLYPKRALKFLFAEFAVKGFARALMAARLFK